MPGLLDPTSPTTSHADSFGRNYDYNKKYHPDNLGDEAAENARIWNVYLDEAENYDADMIQGFRNIIDGLLVFAALFSAVVTTFVAQTSQSLQPDNGQIMVSLLYENNQLLRAVGNGTSVNAVPQAVLRPGSRTHSLTDLWVNGLFLTSLALSLSTALLTVLAKQWIQAYTVVVPGGAQTRALIRHFRFKGLVKWKLGEVIESLPLILHSSVALFFIGLALYVFQLSSPICGVVSAITALTFVFYFGTSMLPAFDVACPYRIPFMFSLTKPLVFFLRAARYVYFKLRNNFTRVKNSEMWPDISKISLKIAEKSQAFPSYYHRWDTAAASRACDPMDWVFNHSSNKSAKDIVVQAVCALLEEWNSNEDFRENFYDIVSSPEHSNLFLSVATYSLSQLFDAPARSATEQDLKQSTCGRLIKNLMTISSSKSLFDEGITNLKNWRQEIERVWIMAYSKAVSSRHRILSRRLLDWGEPMFQSGRQSSILFACAQGGDAEDIRDLVDRGMNLNSHDSRDGLTALHYAALSGNLDAVIDLSQRKPGLISAQAKHLFSQQPCTALDLAFDFGKPEVVAYLLDHGAKLPPNALHAAVQSYWVQPDKRLAMVQVLLDRGWDRTAKDVNGRTPINVVHDLKDPRFSAIVEHLKKYQTVELCSLPTANHITHLE